MTTSNKKPFNSCSKNMWSNLPFDVLANIFSFLPPDSLARAKSACRHWHTCAKTYSIIAPPSEVQRNPAWFVALPTRNHRLKCYAHNPIIDNWHGISLDFIPDPVRLIAPIGGLLLLKPTSGGGISLQLAICNIFTRQYRRLPVLSITRTNPAVGSIVFDPSPLSPSPYFKIYVAGGMSNAPRGGATYESTLEMYDSRHDKWQIIGSMPMEFAVRLTVWTPNESVYSNGVLYWMTSARAYSVMGLEIGQNTWKELSVPLSDRLEFAALVRRNGKLTLVGGTTGQGACIWELNERDNWVLVEKVPFELGMRFLGVQQASWGNTKCVGSDGVVCLYRDLRSGMVVWREIEMGKWEWNWVEGCCSIRGKQVQNLPIKGVLLHPTLAVNIL